jgi:hypothetical protein
MKGLFIGLAAFCCTPALAQPGWYVGAGLGQGYSTIFQSGIQGVEPANYDRHDSVYTIRGGYRFGPALAVEAAYQDLGEYTLTVNGGDAVTTQRARAKSYGVSVVAIAPWDRLDIYGRIGYARTELEQSGSSSGPTNVFIASSSGRTSEAVGAVGLRWWAVPNVGLFAEYQKHDKLEVDSWFAGLDYRF